MPTEIAIPTDAEIDDKVADFIDMDDDDRMVRLYRELIEFRRDVAELEARAAKMTDPDAMMKMAEKFLGNGFGGM